MAEGAGPAGPAAGPAGPAEPAGRVLYAGLSLLDRQLLDRNAIACGKVDDVELESSPDTGELYVTAILSGPGMLAYRLKRQRWGRWVQRVNELMSPGDGDPNRIPMSVVSKVADHIELAVEHGHLGSAGLDHWVREHIISHIPGSGHEAES